MKFTVLLITYNAKLPQIYMTIDSIIQQRFDDFELVIADDGSKENHFTELAAYLDEKGFSKYILVGNEKNQGTVKNLLSGLAQTNGKYVKFISPGDTLYDENTLQQVYEFMEREQCEGCFGLIRGYQWNEAGERQEVGYYHPFDINAYRCGDCKRIIRNLVLYSDNVCGASICYKTDYALEYMQRISPFVLYEEDIFQVLAAVEGRELKLYDDYMIWYEIGTGITTQKKSGFEEKIRQDVERFYLELYRIHGTHPDVKKRYRLMKFYKIQNLYLRTFLRFFVNPDAIRYLLCTMIQKKRGAHKKEER